MAMRKGKKQSRSLPETESNSSESSHKTHDDITSVDALNQCDFVLQIWIGRHRNLKMSLKDIHRLTRFSYVEAKRRFPSKAVGCVLDYYADLNRVMSDKEIHRLTGLESDEIDVLIPTRVRSDVLSFYRDVLGCYLVLRATQDVLKGNVYSGCRVTHREEYGFPEPISTQTPNLYTKSEFTKWIAAIMAQPAYEQEKAHCKAERIRRLIVLKKHFPSCFYREGEFEDQMKRLLAFFA